MTNFLVVTVMCTSDCFCFSPLIQGKSTSLMLFRMMDYISQGCRMSPLLGNDEMMIRALDWTGFPRSKCEIHNEKSWHHV